MNVRNPERRKEGPLRPRSNMPSEGMSRRDLLAKNALVWSSMALMLGVAAFLASRLVGR